MEKRTYVIEGPYLDGATLFGSCVAGRFQLLEYDENEEIVGGQFFSTLDEARDFRRELTRIRKGPQ